MNTGRPRISIEPPLNTPLLSTKSSTAIFDFSQNASLSLQEQFRLVSSPSPRARGALAESPYLFPEIQALLAADKDKNVRATLAVNPSLLPELQLSLSKSKTDSTVIRALLAINPGLLPSLQFSFAKSRSLAVRYTLSQNPSLKLKSAILLYYDKDVIIRRRLKKFNSKLYQKITRLEHQRLRSANLQFAALATESERFSIAKSIMKKYSQEME